MDKMVTWDTKNALPLFNKLVELSKTKNINAGKLAKTKGLTVDQITRPIDINVQMTFAAYGKPGDTGSVFSVFSVALKNYRAFMKLDYGIPASFTDHLYEMFGLNLEAVEPKIVENFLDTGERLATYISFTVFVNAVRRDEYARKNMKDDVRTARELLSVMGISLDTLEEFYSRDMTARIYGSVSHRSLSGT